MQGLSCCHRFEHRGGCVYSTIMKSIKDDGTPLKVVQKLLTSTVGEWDFSAQETCHLLLMLPMF